MKNKLLKILTVIICLPVLLLTACSKVKSDLKTINLATYYNNTIKYSTYGKQTTLTTTLDKLTAKEPDLSTLGQYTSFEFTANPVWVYKLYIEYIYFYVYTDIDVDSQMTINISITNLADEDDIKNPNNDFTADCSLIPQKDSSFLCEVKVDKVIATATGSKMTIDILNTPEVFYDNLGESNGFKWCIYGLEFYAESRAYSK